MAEHVELMTSCNSLKTTCVKSYCECFSNKGFCSHSCKCQDCWNREDRRTFVEEFSELKLKTKPSASQSKGLALTGEQRTHVKGCTCNKSGCKKKYCECFKKQVACTTRCKCQGCANSYGTGGKGLQENGGSDGSPGGSNESAVVTNEELLRPTEASMLENVAATADPQDSGFLKS